MQWFGDTVTFAFWGDLWLAEGLATYFENVGGEAAAAGSDFLDRFYADSVTRCLDHDAAAGATHPLATNASGVVRMSAVSWSPQRSTLGDCFFADSVRGLLYNEAADGDMQPLATYAVDMLQH